MTWSNQRLRPASNKAISPLVTLLPRSKSTSRKSSADTAFLMYHGLTRPNTTRTRPENHTTTTQSKGAP